MVDRERGDVAISRSCQKFFKGSCTILFLLGGMHMHSKLDITLTKHHMTPLFESCPLGSCLATHRRIQCMRC